MLYGVRWRRQGEISRVLELYPSIHSLYLYRTDINGFWIQPVPRALAAGIRLTRFLQFYFPKWTRDRGTDPGGSALIR